MERGDWENDPDYPRAPLPAHERTWRHPSEIGATQWTATEPPLVVGRGLSVATGTIGALLALGLLWVIIPHEDSGGVAAESSNAPARVLVTASSGPATTISRVGSSAPLTSPPSSSTPLTDTTADPVTTPSTTRVATTTVSLAVTVPVTDALQSPATTNSERPPIPTLQISPSQTQTALPAVAVALTSGHLVVTTAAAVRGRDGFPVQLPSGEVVTGAVIAIDAVRGTAVLSVAVDVSGSMIAPSSVDSTSAAVTMIANRETPASIWSDESGTNVGYDTAVAAGEGALVLDADRHLVGMCTMTDGGTRLVPVSSLMEALANAQAAAVPAWLGITAMADGGLVTLIEVLGSGPASAGGLLPGDVLSAVNGQPITDLETLQTAFSAFVAGDMVTITVVRPGAEAPIDLVVTLSQKPWSL